MGLSTMNSKSNAADSTRSYISMKGYHWEAKSGRVSWLRVNVIRDERLSSTNNIRISLTWRALSPTNNIREAIDVMNVSSTNSNSYNSRISKFLNRFEHHWRDEWLSDQEPNINEQHSEKPLTWWVSHREQQLARISPAWRTQSQWPSKRECHWDATRLYIRISLTWRALSPTNNIREAIDVMNVSSTNSNSLRLNQIKPHVVGEMRELAHP